LRIRRPILRAWSLLDMSDSSEEEEKKLCDERSEERDDDRSGERSDEQQNVRYCAMLYKVVASLLPSFAPRPISPRNS